MSSLGTISFPDNKTVNIILLLIIVGIVVWIVFFRKPSAVEMNEGYDPDEAVLNQLKQILKDPHLGKHAMSDSEFDDAFNSGRVQISAEKDGGKEGFAYYFPSGSFGVPQALYTNLYDYAPRQVDMPGWRFMRTRQRVFSPGSWVLYRNVWYFINS